MIVNCPTCAAPVTWSSDSEYRPFCSKKCQLIDLGDWATEERKIATENSKRDSQNDIDIEDIEAMLSQQSDDFFKH